ncbi:MAG: chorismate lyase [Halioglobus sp.]|nr:chorismate lyase [Halioglobus sp.]
MLATAEQEPASVYLQIPAFGPRGHRQRRIRHEPRWRPQERYTNVELPPACRRWLTDDGSLTSRLIGLNRGEFRVQRLFQGWAVPLPSERSLLATGERRLALIREVVLWLGDEQVVFARSIFPLSSLGGSLAHLRRLQNKSLGAILFSHPRMRRSPFELAHLAGDSDYLPQELRQEAPAWGRRSRFDIEGSKLMVSEVFLQPFTPWPAILPVHRSQRGRVSAAIAAGTQ